MGANVIVGVAPDGVQVRALLAAAHQGRALLVDGLLGVAKGVSRVLDPVGQGLEAPALPGSARPNAAGVWGQALAEYHVPPGAPWARVLVERARRGLGDVIRLSHEYVPSDCERAHFPIRIERIEICVDRIDIIAREHY